MGSWFVLCGFECRSAWANQTLCDAPERLTPSFAHRLFSICAAGVPDSLLKDFAMFVSDRHATEVPSTTPTGSHSLS